MSNKRLIDNFFNESEEEDVELDDLHNENEKNEMERYKNKKDLKNVDNMRSQMEKYKHKTVSYSDWANKDELVEGAEEEEEIDEEAEKAEVEEDLGEQDEEIVEKTKMVSINDYETTKAQLDEEDKEYLKTISKHTPSEVKKGKNVQNQKNLFEFFIGIRIYIQKILSVVNLLPQKTSLHLFLDKSTTDNHKQTINSFYNLLIAFIKTQKAVLKRTGIYGKLDSDSFDEIEDILEGLINEGNMEEVSTAVYNLNESIQNVCEKIINIWYRKTLTYTFKSNTKLMRILNNNFCEHIKTNINNNYESVRGNTRKKNPTEKILGKKTASFTKETDKEIYNDVDFYNFLLKEFVSNKQDEDKVVDGNRYDLTLQYILNKNQNKKNKNVDTKASKNRKLRFDKHEKLINFMVPLENLNMNTGRNELIKSIFGLNKTIKPTDTDVEDIEII
jgi:protein AATF/BFR2